VKLLLFGGNYRGLWAPGHERELGDPTFDYSTNVGLIHLLDPGSIVLSDHVGVHMPEHFRDFFRALPDAKLPYRERVAELFAVGLLAPRPSRIVECR